jgi:hypothetical protein
MDRPTDMTQSNTIRPMPGLREIMDKFAQCMRDERGAAMTEYLIVTVIIMLPAALYLFHPDNGLYKDFRDQYNLTTLLLMLPGP